MRYVAPSFRPLVPFLLSLAVVLVAGQVLLGARAPQSQLVVAPISFKANAIVGEPFLENLCAPPLSGPGDFCGAPVPAQNPSGGTPPYQFRVDAMGGALPPGLTLYPNGVIAGTPTTPGTFVFRAIVVDKAGQIASFEVKLPVWAKQIKQCPLEFVGRTLKSGVVGGAYFDSICQPEISLNGVCGSFSQEPANPRGCQSPYSFTLDAMGGFPPFGLVLNPNGTISGTPTAQGSRTFKVCAKDVGGTFSCQDFTIDVAGKKETKDEPKAGTAEPTAGAKPKKKMDPVMLGAIGGGAALAGILVATQVAGEETGDTCGSRPTCQPLSLSGTARQQCISQWNSYCISCGFSYFDTSWGSCR